MCARHMDNITTIITCCIREIQRFCRSGRGGRGADSLAPYNSQQVSWISVAIQ
jgi:hypothetical protein